MEEFASFSNVGKTKMDLPAPKREKQTTRICVCIPVFLMVLAIIISLSVSLSRNSKNTSDEEGDPQFDVNITGMWIQRGSVVYGDEPDYQTGASVSLAGGW